MSSTCNCRGARAPGNLPTRASASRTTSAGSLRRTSAPCPLSACKGPDVMTEPVVLLDRPAPHVARLRINRPDKRNAIDHAVRELITQHLRKLLADGETRALVFGG